MLGDSIILFLITFGGLVGYMSIHYGTVNPKELWELMFGDK